VYEYGICSNTCLRSPPCMNTHQRAVENWTTNYNSMVLYLRVVTHCTGIYRNILVCHFRTCGCGHSRGTVTKPGIFGKSRETIQLELPHTELVLSPTEIHNSISLHKLRLLTLRLGAAPAHHSISWGNPHLASTSCMHLLHQKPVNCSLEWTVARL